MKDFVGQNKTGIGVGAVVILLTLQIVMPYVGASEGWTNEGVTQLLQAANQYRVPTARIEQLNRQQCESDKMSTAAHLQLVQGLSDLARNLAILSKSTESLQRSIDRIERDAGP